jgi:hypothetical protein
MQKIVAVITVLYLAIATAHIRRNSKARERRGVNFAY